MYSKLLPALIITQSYEIIVFLPGVCSLSILWDPIRVDFIVPGSKSASSEQGGNNAFDIIHIIIEIHG